MTKIACVYHSVDLDGWMSAAIVKHYYTQKNINNNVTNDQINMKSEGLHTEIPILFSHKELDFIGFNYGMEIPDLTKYDKVIMCDISFPKETMIKLALRLGLNFIWNDHHISAIDSFKCSDVEGGYYPEGNRNTEFAACELTWKYFFPDQPMPEIVRLLGRYDCFRHKGTSEEKRVLEFQYGARQCIKNHEDASYYLNIAIRQEDAHMIENVILRKGMAIYEYLCTMAKQIYDMKFDLYFTEELIDVQSAASGKMFIKRRFAAINHERFNPINFGIDYHADGYDGVASFHYVRGKIKFSIYNDNGLVDCSSIATFLGGGGHKGASGFILDVGLDDTDNLTIELLSSVIGRMSAYFRGVRLLRKTPLE